MTIYFSLFFLDWLEENDLLELKHTDVQPKEQILFK